MPGFHIESRLCTSVTEVWSAITVMPGVNAELMPLVRMTYPSEAKTQSIADAPAGEFLFWSWILAFGFIPIDRHHLRLVEIRPGEGFVEESVSWLQRRWRHERTVRGLPNGCVVTDRLTFEPRIGWAAPLVARIVGVVFRHRHRRLNRRYGEIAI